MMPLPSRRYCKRCRQQRDVNWRKPGTLAYCPECLSAVARKEPTGARAREAAKKKQRVDEALAWVDSYKSARGCLRCGETDPLALDCQPRDPAAKEINIAALVRRRPDLSVVANELLKCDVLCASCRRKEPRPLLKKAAFSPAPRRSAHTDPMLADLLSTAPPGSVETLELRRVTLAELLKSTKDSLEVLLSAGVSTREALKQRAELDNRRRALSVSLMKADAEISARTSLVDQPTDKAADDDLTADVLIGDDPPF